jgi:hypothetical protein
MDTGAVSVEAPNPPTYWTHPDERGVGFQGSTGTNLSVSEASYPGSPASLLIGTAKAIRTGSPLEWSRPSPVRRSGVTGSQMHTIASNGDTHVDFTIWLFASQDRVYTIQAQFLVDDPEGRRAVRRFLGSVRVALPTPGTQP